jgi:hypothetical protein
VQRAFSELLHKRDLLQKERKNEKIPLLEFLEGCLSGLDDTLSTPFFCSTRILYCHDI